MSEKQYDIALDARGMLCPLPLLKAKALLKEMSTNQTLYVISTDKGSWHDFHAFVRQAGLVLKEAYEEQGTFYFWIKKV